MTEKNDVPFRLRKKGLRYDDIDGALDLEMDRPRGILTDDDREFLLDVGDTRSDHAADAQRRRMRRRVRNALMDFTVLNHALSEDDRAAIFDPPSAATETPDEILGSLVSLIAFVYDGHSHMQSGEFESTLSTGIEEAKYREGWLGVEVDVTVDITAEKRMVDLDEAAEKFEAGKPLTDREVGALLRYDRIDPAEWDELADRNDPSLTGFTEKSGTLGSLDEREQGKTDAGE